MTTCEVTTVREMTNGWTVTSSLLKHRELLLHGSTLLLVLVLVLVLVVKCRSHEAAVPSIISSTIIHVFVVCDSEYYGM